MLGSKQNSFVLLHLIMLHPFKCNASVMKFPCSPVTKPKITVIEVIDLSPLSFIKGTAPGVSPTDAKESRGDTMVTVPLNFLYNSN